MSLHPQPSLPPAPAHAAALPAVSVLRRVWVEAGNRRQRGCSCWRALAGQGVGQLIAVSTNLDHVGVALGASFRQAPGLDPPTVALVPERSCQSECAAARSVSASSSIRFNSRTAARTCVLSVRLRPRALSKPPSRAASSRRSVASPPNSLPRNSHSTLWSKPGSARSRASRYFQSMRARTASAACRSLSPSRNCSSVTRASRQGA